MRYEHFSQPVVPFRQWARRAGRSFVFGAAIIGGGLVIGIAGYHVLGRLSWIDSFLEASMILGGMGSIAPMQSDAVKIFASIYALFSGLVGLSSAAIILAPWLHRIMHHLHATPGREHHKDK